MKLKISLLVVAIIAVIVATTTWQGSRAQPAGVANAPMQGWSIQTSGSISATNGTTSFPTPFCFKWMTGVFTAAATNGITLTIDRAAGSTYDSILYVVPGANTLDFLQQPDGDGEICLLEGDQLKVDYTNPSVVRASIMLGVRW